MPAQTVIPLVYGASGIEPLRSFTGIPHYRVRRLQRAETGTGHPAASAIPGIRGALPRHRPPAPRTPAAAAPS